MRYLTGARGDRFVALWVALMVLMAAPQVALAQGVSLSGLITARDGPHMTVADSAGQETVVTLTDETRVTSVGGTFGLQRNDMGVTDLINGLAVSVTGVEHNGGVTINRPPRDGRMAFVRSPEGISIELLQKGGSLPKAEPWTSMPNVGAW